MCKVSSSTLFYYPFLILCVSHRFYIYSCNLQPKSSLDTESAVLGFVVHLVRTFYRGPEYSWVQISVFLSRNQVHVCLQVGKLKNPVTKLKISLFSPRADTWFILIIVMDHMSDNIHVSDNLHSVLELSTQVCLIHVHSNAS